MLIMLPAGGAEEGAKCCMAARRFPVEHKGRHWQIKLHKQLALSLVICQGMGREDSEKMVEIQSKN